MNDNLKQQEKKSQRLLSLDVFRGITILGMIIVNSAGNDHAYAFIDHAVWNGCTLADLVFPFFIFILGVSSVFSITKQLEKGESKNQIFIKILKRSAIIFLLGLILNGFPHYHLTMIRITGVLQRIAICYFFAALLFLVTRVRTQIFVMLSLLIGYWFVMNFIPVPGYGAGNLTPIGNLAAYLDRLLLGKHIFLHSVYDPEGILSSMPAIASALLGNLTGVFLLSKTTSQMKVFAMMTSGILALTTGWIWGLWFPINKSLWTSSYVLWTGGIALCVLALLYWIIEIKKWRRWSKTFEIFGVNALAAYFLHVLFLGIQNRIYLTSANGSPINLRNFITEYLFGWASLPNASLLYALSYAVFWFIILWILYKNKIFIKV